MSDRNMKRANETVFAALDKHCLEKENPISNSGKRRWIASVKETKPVLKESILASSISFSSNLQIARFDHNHYSYFFTVGLDLSEIRPYNFLNEVDIDGSLLTLVLAELRPQPLASTYEIRNIIEVDDADGNPNYQGHSAEEIASLFPKVRCYEAENLSADETQRVFFLLCLADRTRSATWMKGQLKETFASLSDLNPTSIPYQTLCRSVFDTDPSSVFLSIYRCLEALYAYSHVTSLNGKLGLSQPWDQVAELLEQQLGWRPREESSLNSLLRGGPLKHDLEEALSAMNIALQPSADVFNVATKSIYQLRNSLVHYRPFHQRFTPQDIDWNRLCMAMCCLVLDAYEATTA